MKPGDKVWVRDTLVDGYNDMDVGDSVWVEETTGKIVFVARSEVLPDHPALPGIAAWLEQWSHRFMGGQPSIEFLADWLEKVSTGMQPTSGENTTRCALCKSLAVALRSSSEVTDLGVDGE